MKITRDGIRIDRISWPRFSCIAIALVMFWQLLYISSTPDINKKIISSDGAGYYAYLPAVFIYHDYKFSFAWHKDPSTVQFIGCDHNLFSNLTTDGKLVNKYTFGTAILQSPFFLVAYGTAELFGHHANGYSFPFQIAIALAAIFYVLLGLEQIRRLLAKLGIPEFAQAATLLLLFFGTNLYHYALGEPAMSHAYSFGMVALFLNQSHNLFHAKQKRAVAFVIIIFVLIVLIRPVNGFVICALPFIAGSWKNFISGLRFVFGNISQLAIGIGVFALLVFLQLVFWKLQTGSWIVYTYQGESFNMAHTHFADVLFSWRKGWFIYTPLMLIAFAGIFFFRSNYQRITFLVFMLINFWVVASWSSWWYGGSLGMRPMVDTLAMMAIPLAFLSAKILRRWWLIVSVPLFGFLVLLNLVQHYQFHIGIMPYDEMTWPKYKKIWFETDKFYNSMYDPWLLRILTVPEGSALHSAHVRTFEEDLSDGRFSPWGVTAEKAYEGKYSVKIDTALTSAGVQFKLSDTLPTELYARTWVVLKSKVFLVDEARNGMSISFRNNGNEYSLISRPIIFAVDTSNKWQDYYFAWKLPIPPSPDIEICAFMVRGENSVAYADNMSIEIWIEPEPK